ncbi:Oxidase FUB9 [Fusarium oxysporum f. sp. albedinis]|nr:Oxidase FUB9 [Fusarium oxysporum f. sp. albedinis]
MLSLAPFIKMREGDTRAPLILGVVLTLLLLTFSVVLLRVYTRAMLLKQFGTDDIWAVLSMVSHGFNPLGQVRR